MTTNPMQIPSIPTPLEAAPLFGTKHDLPVRELSAEAQAALDWEWVSTPEPALEAADAFEQPSFRLDGHGTTRGERALRRMRNIFGL